MPNRPLSFIVRRRGSPVKAILCALGVLALPGIAACGSGSPVVPLTAPSPTISADDRLLRLLVDCPSSLLIGQRGPCGAVAFYSSGRQPLVSLDATWSSSHPEVVAVDRLYIIAGMSAGQATVTASYQGQQASDVVLVIEEDAVRLSAAADQGLFRPGDTVTMWLQGYYSVASAETGRLSVRITDQPGTVVTTVSIDVRKGGDLFVLPVTFVVPEGSTRLCRQAVLEVGTITIVEPQSNQPGFFCKDVRPPGS
jgi:hypothetical protein